MPEAPDTTATTKAGDVSKTPEGVLVAEAGPPPGKASSLWSDAWRDLRRKPKFVIPAIIILFLLFVAAFPSVFTSETPRLGDLTQHYLQKPELTHFFQPDWFGYDQQGRSIYARVVYGTRASVIIGISVTALVLVTGGIIGMLAGYFGGWIDAVLSRITDTFMGIPFMLGAMVVLVSFNARTEWVVILALAFLGWTTVARVMRGSVITIKQADYVQAARSLGAGTGRILLRHILPNAAAPVIVVAMVALGGYITAEATLSYLGIGLSDPAISWGGDINSARDQIRVAEHILIFPSIALSVTILSFLMLGDAVRDALDPKLR
ncbi:MULTISPECIES: ABC transporter permease [Streptomyces]|uniref:Peptide/nickel transport system permease protein/oligopeptide transport system permease protein n=2 Tax=Streptomyces TaxID=1883 RepID=A0A1I6TZ86_9ACTN|nr:MULTISPECIES: ABC transporter permease [Streptomyces]MCK1815630.1 ABC transporter permease [Streptomyces sp. XM4011]QKV70491.1 ABC transporter permease [Streptomyces harbinensis]SFS94549.1 peptide/nickel transport system permease protein/oligopeptide transport system permease protein [Streptomyces harbinensis]